MGWHLYLGAEIRRQLVRVRIILIRTNEACHIASCMARFLPVKWRIRNSLSLARHTSPRRTIPDNLLVPFMGQRRAG